MLIFAAFAVGIGTGAAVFYIGLRVGSKLAWQTKEGEEPFRHQTPSTQETVE